MIRLNNLLENEIERKYENCRQDIFNLNNRLNSAKEEINREFPQEAEYKELLREQAEVNAKLTICDKPSDNTERNSSETDAEESKTDRPMVRR